MVGGAIKMEMATPALKLHEPGYLHCHQVLTETNGKAWISGPETEQL